MATSIVATFDKTLKFHFNMHSNVLDSGVSNGLQHEKVQNVKESWNFTHQKKLLSNRSVGCGQHLSDWFVRALRNGKHLMVIITEFMWH